MNRKMNDSTAENSARENSSTTMTLGNLKNRLSAVMRGIKKEPESRLVDDIRDFMAYAEATGLNGTLTKAREMFNQLDAFMQDRYVRKIMLPQLAELE